MNGEQRTHISIESDDLDAMAEGDVFAFGVPGNTESVSIELTDEATEYLNDLRADDLLGKREIAHDSATVENILTEYYSQPVGRRFLGGIMEERPNWVPIGGWGNSAYYDPYKDIGLVRGDNDELAVLKGLQARNWSDEAWECYDEVHDTASLGDGDLPDCDL